MEQGFRGKLASASLKHGFIGAVHVDTEQIPRQACLGLIEARSIKSQLTNYLTWIPRQACLGLIEASFALKAPLTLMMDSEASLPRPH